MAEQAEQITQAIIASAIFGVLFVAWIYSDQIVAFVRPLWDRYVTPRPVDVPVIATETSAKSAVSAVEINYETAETPRSNAETEHEKICFAETAVAEALAQLIHAEKLGLTDAVRIGCGKKSGPAYQEASNRIKAALDEIKAAERTQFRPLDADKRPVAPVAASAREEPITA